MAARCENADWAIYGSEFLKINITLTRISVPIARCSSLVAGAVVLVILAAIDAAYSGDWSRIGVISKDVELGLRPLLALLGFFHIFCGSVAAIAASKKGYNPVPPTLKVQTSSPLCWISSYLALRLDSASV